MVVLLVDRKSFTTSCARTHTHMWSRYSQDSDHSKNKQENTFCWDLFVFISDLFVFISGLFVFISGLFVFISVTRRPSPAENPSRVRDLNRGILPYILR